MSKSTFLHSQIGLLITESPLPRSIERLKILRGIIAIQFSYVVVYSVPQHEALLRVLSAIERNLVRTSLLAIRP